jgi:hypothetical protein
MLTKFMLSLVIGVTTLGFSLAQQPSANPNAPSNPAVSTPSTPSAATPAPGANSFTEAQAKMRLENQGFTAVSALMKDADGIWRGMATKAGRSLNVAVDYQGNIVEK